MLQVTARIQCDYMPSLAQGQWPLDESVRKIPHSPAPFRQERGLRARQHCRLGNAISSQTQPPIFPFPFPFQNFPSASGTVM